MAAILVGEEPYSFDPAVSEWGNPASCETSEFDAKAVRIDEL